MKSLKLDRIILIFASVLILFLERPAYLNTTLFVVLVSSAFILVLTWLVKLKAGGLHVLRSDLTIGFLGLAAAAILSTLFSLDPSRSLRFLWGALFALTSFYIFLTFVRTTFAHNPLDLINILLAITAIFIILGYLEFFLQIPDYWSFYAQSGQLPRFIRLAGYTYSWNFLGALASIFIVISFGRFLVEPDSQIGWGGAIIFALPMLVGSGSSGAILAAVIGSATVFVTHNWELIERLSKTQKRIGLSGLMVVAIVGASLGIQYILQDQNSLIRVTFWTIAFDMFVENPIFGSGLNTFASYYDAASKSRFIFWHTHNLLINIFAESGLIGGIFATGLIAQIGWRSIKNWDRIQGSTIGKISFGALVTFSVQILVETPVFSWIGIAMLLLALLYECCLSTESQRQVPLIELTWPIIGTALIVIGFIIIPFRNDYDRGVELARAQDWAAAAVTFDTLIDQRLIADSGLLYASAITHGMLAEENEEHRSIAIEHYSELIVLEPGWSANYANLAWLESLNENVDLAAENYQMAVMLKPNQPVFLLNKLLIQNELIEYADTLFFIPRTWHAAPLWNDVPNREDLVQILKNEGCEGFPEIKNCSTYKATELTDAWEKLAIGESREAAELLNEFERQNGVGSDESVLLGQSLITQNNLVEDLTHPPSLANGTSTIHPILYGHWINVSEMKPADLQPTLELITNRTAQGLGRDGYDSYTKFVLTRPALPYDLLPGLQCFTVDDRWAWQLSTLANWYTTNGRDDLATMIHDAMAGPDGQGIAPCIKPLPPEE